MSKSSAAGGVNPAGGRGTSAIVDVVHRRRSDRLARLTFMTLVSVLVPVVTVVASTVTGPLAALLVGVAVGVGVAVLAAVVVFCWPVLRMVWYWAGEIALAVLATGGYWALTLWVPWWAAAGVVAAVVVVPLLPPGSRRVVTAWGWCAVSRHRLRTCFATFIRANRYGSLPLILVARPTRAGERVWVWLRPGLSLEDLTTESGLDRLAVGCWARQVKLTRASGRYAALLRVDVSRRRPLADTVVSPLPDLLADLPGDQGEGPDVPVSPAPAGAGGMPAGLDLDSVPTAGPAEGSPTPVPRRNGGRRQRPAPVEATDDLAEWV